MEASLFLLLMGLEVTGFPAGDDAADALVDSVEVLESGGWSLTPYDGPALQPYIGVRGKAYTVTLAPALATRKGTATTLEGVEQDVRTVQWKVEGRFWYTPAPLLLGVDVAGIGGTARLDGVALDAGGSALQLAPTAGMRVAVHERVDLVARARWVVRSSSGVVEQGLGGAAGIELHR